jgi:hypothetical protein
MAQQQLFPRQATGNESLSSVNGSKYDLIIRAILRTISTLTRKNILCVNQLRSRSMVAILSSDPLRVMTISDVLERGASLSSFRPIEDSSSPLAASSSISSKQKEDSKKSALLDYLPLIFGEIVRFFLDDLSRDESSAAASDLKSHLLTLIAIPDINLATFDAILYSHLTPAIGEFTPAPAGGGPSRRPSPITISVSEEQQNQLVKFSLLFNSAFSADDAETFTKTFKQNLEYQKLDI